MKIRHITPHLGGGVGRVILSWLSRANRLGGQEHEILCLEDANESARESAGRASIGLTDTMDSKPERLWEEIGAADIVVLHWWNHPRLYNLMINQELPPCRMVLWSHVAGHSAPHIFTRKLIAYPDRFVVSTPYSLEAPAMKSIDRRYKDQHVRLVFTCAGTERVSEARHETHDGFNVGYIGTVDYCKLHPAFVEMSAAADIPDARFIVCGGDRHESIRKEAEEKGVGERFVFTGPVADIVRRLNVFDVFGYPLCPDHYGTGEQAVIEAMAAGIPVVVFGNGTEKHLVEDGVTGLVVQTEEEYSAALERLYRDRELRATLGNRAREIAVKRFSLDEMVDDWTEELADLINEKKRKHTWNAAGTMDGAELYVESLGDAGGPFRASREGKDGSSVEEAEQAISQLKGAFLSETRGSPFHYKALFPDDPWLNRWCALLENART